MNHRDTVTNNALRWQIERLKDRVNELERKLQNYNETDATVAEWSKIYGTVHHDVPGDKGSTSQIPLMPYFHAGNSAQCHSLPVLPQGATERREEDKGIPSSEGNPVGLSSKDRESIMTYRRVQKEHYAAFWEMPENKTDVLESADFDAPTSEPVWLDTMPPDRYTKR